MWLDIFTTLVVSFRFENTCTVNVFSVLLNFASVTARDALIPQLETVLNDKCVKSLAQLGI